MKIVTGGMHHEGRLVDVLLTLWRARVWGPLCCTKWIVEIEGFQSNGAQRIAFLQQRTRIDVSFASNLGRIAVELKGQAGNAFLRVRQRHDIQITATTRPSQQPDKPLVVYSNATPNFGAPGVRVAITIEIQNGASAADGEPNQGQQPQNAS